MSKTSLPLKTKNLIRILVLIVILLAYLAGFYHSAWKTELKKSEYLQQQLDQSETNSLSN